MGKNHLIAVPTDRLGGAENVLRTWALEVCRRGDKVEVLVLSRGNSGGWEASPPGISVHYVHSPRESLGMLLALPFVWQISRQRRLQCVFSSHVHVNSWFGLLRTCGVLRCNRLIARESTVVSDRFFGVRRVAVDMLYRVGYGPQDLVICQTDYMRRRLAVAITDSSRWPVRFIPNPVDLKRISERSAAILPPEWVGLQYICAVGRLIPVKGFDILLRAFGIIAKSNPYLRLVIIGKGPDRAALESLAVGLGVSERVRFLGHLTNPMPLVKGASVAVVSSRVEGFPNTLLEMMAVNPRVVCTRCAGGVEEIKGVFSCATDDPRALAEALRSALVADTARTRRLLDAELKHRLPAVFVDTINSRINEAGAGQGTVI